MLHEYVSPKTQSEVGRRLRELIGDGADRDKLHELLELVMTESWYTMLLALDGEASLGGMQMTCGLYDEDGHRMNPCGELEAAAWEVFMDQNN